MSRLRYSRSNDAQLLDLALEGGPLGLQRADHLAVLVVGLALELVGPGAGLADDPVGLGAGLGDVLVGGALGQRQDAGGRLGRRCRCAARPPAPGRRGLRRRAAGGLGSWRWAAASFWRSSSFSRASGRVGGGGRRCAARRLRRGWPLAGGRNLGAQLVVLAVEPGELGLDLVEELVDLGLVVARLEPGARELLVGHVLGGQRHGVTSGVSSVVVFGRPALGRASSGIDPPSRAGTCVPSRSDTAIVSRRP